MISSKSIRNCLESHVGFLETVINVANCHMVDFFTQNLFRSVLPKAMLSEIDNVGVERAIQVLTSSDLSENTPILNEFVKTTEQLTLYNCKNVCISVNDLLDKIREWGFESHPGLHLNVFMNSKKSHEVEIMSTVTAAIAKLSNTSYIIDLGDGKGYLSSMLAMHHQIPVLGIDASSVNTKGAAKRAAKLEKFWHDIAHLSKTEKRPENMYKQSTQYVTENTCFTSALRDNFDLTESQLGTLRLGLIGLHTCGSLAVSSLKLYCSNTNVKTICNVGCCYHLLDADLSKREEVFPLSNYMKEQARVKISRNCKMIAMQSIDRQTHNQESPNQILFYRSILQVFLERYFEANVIEMHVGRLRKECSNFMEYSHIALKKLGIDSAKYCLELEAVYREYESQRETLNLFYFIRARLGPVIEAVILLDRLLFLVEKGYTNSTLVQLFNPVTSPRCYGIVSFKIDV